MHIIFLSHWYCPEDNEDDEDDDKDDEDGSI